jgi:hypothetical protein
MLREKRIKRNEFAAVKKAKTSNKIKKKEKKDKRNDSEKDEETISHFTLHS